MEVEIFEITPGQFAYRVDGVYQEWAPGAEGNVPMSKEEAERNAAEVASRIGE